MLSSYLPKPPSRCCAGGGLSHTALYSAAREGPYQRIARGIYLPTKAEAADWDWIEAATRRPDATIYLTSYAAHASALRPSRSRAYPMLSWVSA